MMTDQRLLSNDPSPQVLGKKTTFKLQNIFHFYSSETLTTPPPTNVSIGSWEIGVNDFS